MEYSSFNILQTYIQSLYKDGDYAAVLELATTELTRFPEQFHLLYYWRICMAARLHQNDLVVALIDELLDQGFWYGETLLRKSPSLTEIQGEPEFEGRVARSQTLQNLDRGSLFPLLILRENDRCIDLDESCPLLIGLHANASTAQASVDFWRPAANAGWLVAIPQSNQAIWKGAYVWDDRGSTAQQLKQQLQSLFKQYSINPDRVVVAGHSMGGEIAIWLACENLLPVEGFIAIGPGGPLMDDVENWTAILSDASQYNLRGYLIMGEDDDTIPQENVHLLAEILNQAGIPTDLEGVPAAGHDYSDEYADALLRGLNFIEQ